MKKFVTKDRLPDDNQNIEVVELRQEHQTDGEKICIVSQPAGHGDFSSDGHLYLMGYILDNEFVVVTNGLEERGLTLRVSDKFGYASKDECTRLRNAKKKIYRGYPVGEITLSLQERFAVGVEFNRLYRLLENRKLNWAIHRQ